MHVSCQHTHRFVRVPADYYDQPLEFRRACLKASSVDHLCKSIIMENTRAHPSVQGWEDPKNSKYYVVIVQVGAPGGVRPHTRCAWPALRFGASQCVWHGHRISLACLLCPQAAPFL